MFLKKAVKTWFCFSTLLLTVLTGCFLLSPKEARALGISPPAVINHQLLRGAHFEQRVYINQGDPKEALLATVSINAPENMKSWITLKPGTEFTIPVTKLFPMIVVIDVPFDAALGGYGGEIRITTHPESQEEGQVTIGIGIVVRLDLAVVEKEVIDFRFIGQAVQPMEEGWPVRLILTIDNKGNIGAKPDKVYLEILNRLDGSLLGSGEADKFEPPTAEAFKRSEITAQFSIDLPVGLYWAQGKIYKGEEVIPYKVSFEVLEEGALPRENTWLKKIAVIGGAAVLAAALIIWFLIRVRGKLFSFLNIISRLRPSIKIKEKKAVPKRKRSAPSKKKAIKTRKTA